MTPRRSPIAFLVLVLGASIPACDAPAAGQVAVHPVRGRILFRGKPLSGALVVLHADPKPADSMPRPVGRTDGDGRFSLHTYLGEDGAPSGKYRLSISQTPRSGEIADMSSKNADTSSGASPISSRYSQPEKSGLTAEVRPGDNVLPEIDLIDAAEPAKGGRG